MREQMEILYCPIRNTGFPKIFPENALSYIYISPSYEAGYSACYGLLLVGLTLSDRAGVCHPLAKVNTFSFQPLPLIT